MEEMEYAVLLDDNFSVPDVGGRIGASIPSAPSTSILGSTSGSSLTVAAERFTTKQAADQMRDPRTRAMAPSMPMSLIKPMDMDTPNAQPFDGNIAWGVKAVGAADTTLTGDGVVVAVLDTGIDPNHEAFQGVTLERKNFTDETDDDLNGHGTHCAGTIFGRDVGGKRIGVAPGIKRAMIAKVLGSGGGTSVQIADAINWALSGGAQIISMSLGIDFPGFVKQLVDLNGFDTRRATSVALEGYRANVHLYAQVADLASARAMFGGGAMIVAAAGNESTPEFDIAVAPPAAAEGILAVGAVGQSSNGLIVAPFSNSQVNVVGPGVAIESAKVGGGLSSLNGTSMATPHAAGVAALHAEKIKLDMGILNTVFLKQVLSTSGSHAPLAPSDRDFASVGSGLIQAPA
ncbi:MAG: S8 family peptidase [Arenicella sp.]